MCSSCWIAQKQVSLTRKPRAVLRFSVPISLNPKSRTHFSRFFVCSYPCQPLCSRGADDSFLALCGTRSLGSWKPPPLLPSLSRTVEVVHPTGRILLVSCCSSWQTLPSVSTRKGMQGTRSRLSWTLLRPRPRSSALGLGEKSNRQTWFPET
jgi:hypothetical protein